MVPSASANMPSGAAAETAWSAGYYHDKVQVLQRVFGPQTRVTDDHIVVAGREFPVYQDVILALPPNQYPQHLRRLRVSAEGGAVEATRYARDIQDTFGAEWTTFADILDEHRQEFGQYFDIVDLDQLADATVADLGCGAGRYASQLVGRCGQLVLVDFSEAIFVARNNLRRSDAVFILADLVDPPFADDAFDFAYSLGVLHHLPVNALDALRNLRRLAPRFLIYLYYALDNRPRYYRLLLSLVTRLRRVLAGLTDERVRSSLTTLIAATVYWPLARLGSLLAPVGLDRRVPLADFYRGKSWGRLRQDAYDRFFTRIEQRFARADCLGLTDRDWSVRVSDGLPYWHFLYERRARGD
jgi:SAM-dependent methyltransferase